MNHDSALSLDVQSSNATQLTTSSKGQACSTRNSKDLANIKQLGLWFVTLFTAFIIMMAVVSPAKAAQEKDPLADIFASQPTYLPVDEAFIFDYEQKNNQVTIEFTIADGYYMYADKFQFQGEGVRVVNVEKSGATQIEDEFFGVTEVYFFETELTVTLEKETDADDASLNLNIRYQGCAEAGFCYNPAVKRIAIEPFVTGALDTTSAKGSDVESGDKLKESVIAASSGSSEQNQLADKLANESLIWTLLIFFGLGVGLAFTPCVFPMFPILSSIIAGQSNLTLKKGLWLAFIYVQGMALTYSLMGLVVASMGAEFQAALQHPAVLITVAVIFILLAGAMFGWYNLQLPQSWTNKLTEVSNKQKSGNLIGVFMMGLLSGLIASPCTTAPLTGALLYVAQTGDLVIGFVTLYVLSLGMGLPLLLIGASGGKLLPKAGNWMNVVKNLFGFILLAVPLILLERIVEFETLLLLAGILTLTLAAYLHSQYLAQQSTTVKSGFWLAACLSFGLGFLMLLKPVLPSLGITPSVVQTQKAEFKLIQNYDELLAEIELANSQGKPVMFDLYADWCPACKEFEAFTFSDEAVQNRMKDFVLLKIDMTPLDKEHLEIYEEFEILGLPTILFFDQSGNELTNQRVTGFMNAERFLTHLNRIK